MSKNSLMRQLLEKDFKERLDDVITEQNQEEKYTYTYADPDWEMWEDSLSHYNDYEYDSYNDPQDYYEYYDYNNCDDHCGCGCGLFDDDDDRYDGPTGLDLIFNRRFHAGRYYKNEQSGDIYLCCQLTSGEKHLICTKTGMELRDLVVINKLV